jgi:hypothetical protein
MTRMSLRKKTVTPIVRRLLLFAGAMIVIPVALYPRAMGFPAFDLNPAVSVLEWAFYAAFLGISTSNLPFSTRVVAGGFTVVFQTLPRGACLVCLSP